MAFELGHCSSVALVKPRRTLSAAANSTKKRKESKAKRAILYEYYEEGKTLLGSATHSPETHTPNPTPTLCSQTLTQII